MTSYQFAGPPRFKHQHRGLAKLIETQGVCALVFDPGMGKTATALDYLGLLALRAHLPRRADHIRELRVLVLCPLAAVDTWVEQTGKFLSPQVNYWAEALSGTIKQRAEALTRRGGKRRVVAWASRPERSLVDGPDSLPEDKPRVVLTVLNLDTFASRATASPKGRGGKLISTVLFDAVREYAPDVIVVDESHRIKAPGGNASRLIGRLGSLAKRRIILTGTLMPHSPLDVFAQWRFLEPTAFAVSRPQATFGEFRYRYARMGGWMGKEVIGFQNLDHMERIIAQNASVARKADALDLPPTTDIVVPVDLSPRETTAYNDLRDQLAHQLGPGSTTTVPNRLAQMMRLRQITSGHLPDDNGVVHVIGESKARVIRSIVHDTLAGEKRIVVFALFRHELDTLERLLTTHGTTVLRVDGSTPPRERMAMRKRFGAAPVEGTPTNDRLVMLAQVKTMSLAVNELVTASHAVFASLSQQRDDLIQARDRLDRIGQTRPVTFWYALSPGTVDEVILQSHQDRTDLESALLAHITTHTRARTTTGAA